MAHIHKITVSGKQYNLVEAVAPKQRELLTLLGSRIAYNQATTGVTIDDNMVIGQLLSMSDADLDRVSNIVLWKTVENGSDVLISVDDFQGNMSGYLLLLAGGIRSNLQDFFGYLQNVSAAAKKDQSTEE